MAFGIRSSATPHQPVGSSSYHAPNPSYSSRVSRRTGATRDAVRCPPVHCRIDELFRDIYKDPLDAVELAELEKRTEGWAASLQLVEVSLRERQNAEDRRAFIESITAGSKATLLMLGQEVLDQQPQEVRNFLLSTLRSQRIHPVLARLAGLPDGSAVLERLENGGLFTYRTESGAVGTYEYHGLFRTFCCGDLQ